MRPALVAFLLVLSGCVSAPLDALRVDAPAGSLLVVDAAGAPVPYASVALLAGEAVVARASSDLAGALLLPPVAWERGVASATGVGASAFAPGDARVVLAAMGAQAQDATPGLRMLEPYGFGSIALGPEEVCSVRNTCGLSEPVIEVAGDGSIYVSSTCCVGASPPVWVSRDGGASWSALETPGIREATGIEGDFAVDDAGNVYFTDILVGAMWITSWDKEGNWRHTTPVPFEPLVDRPWVRAGAEDVVYFLYNTGADGTNFHRSTDGGRTFLPVPIQKFEAPLGTLGQGPERDHLWVVAGFQLFESTDGGDTWSAGEPIPEPEGATDDEGTFNFAVPVVDESGRVMVAHDWGSEETGFRVHAAFREPDGAWRSAPVSLPNGTHHLAWPAAGPDGGFAMAWYGTDDDAAHPDTVREDAAWYVFVAATSDAGATWEVARADPEPVATGPLLRRLLDFLQVDLAPDGALHMVYAENRDGTNAEQTWYARSTEGLGLRMLAFPHGPKPSDEAGSLLPRPVALKR